MNATEEKAYIENLLAVYQRANEICRLHPEADRDIVVQSILMEKKTPLEKLNLALLRTSFLKNKKKNHAH